MLKRCSIVLMVCAVAGLAHADTDTSGYGAEAANHASYVRNNAGPILRAQMYLDADYADNVKTLKRTTSVDVQMNQCFSGGFLNDLSGALNAATFRSSAAWNELSLNDERRDPPQGGVLVGLNNYTRASVEGRARVVASGMRPNFRLTRNGLPNLPPVPLAADPFATVGAQAVIGKSHHQYWSPDPVQGPGVATPNDDRTLFHGPAFAQPNVPAGPKQYAILVSWSSTDQRHDVNLARQIDVLTRIERVPLDNIVILRQLAASNVAANAAITLNGMPDGLPAFRSDSGNTIGAFRDALRGDFFKVNGVANNLVGDPRLHNLPGADDKLFIYNTGHGGHGTWNNQLQPDGTNLRQFVPTQGGVNVKAKAAVINDAALASSLVDADGLFSIQVTTSAPLDPAVFLQINGVNPLGGVTPLAPSLLLDESQVLDVTPLLELAGMNVVSSLFTYQVELPWQQIDNAAGTGIDINFGNVFSQSVADSLLAINFASGDQEYTHVFIPAPGILAMFAAGSVALVRRRRNSQA